MIDLKRITIRNKEESRLHSGLYCVPTPIGNLADMTLRALEVLTHCDAVICEDSRVSGKLLAAYGIKDKKKIIYNDHADENTKSKIIAMVEAGKVMALVSDAGTPLVSDPGYKLVRDCLDNGLNVTALPGANAVLPALQLSGLPCDQFFFGGFLPAKDKALRDVLSRYIAVPETLIFYESPKRVEKTLSVIGDVLGNRQMALVREISKLYEDSIRGTAADILTHIQAKPVKGEIVLVISGADEQAAEIDVNAMIRQSLDKGESIKDIAKDLADITGLKKKDLYNRAMAIRDNEG
jgi:16S rRNA (cytidine1402-2'-O)-methyltransferase